MNEYVLIDTIHHLSRGRWCNMSRETMSKEFGISKRGVIIIIDRLCSEGWIEKEEKGALRTTTKWEELIYTNGEQSTPQSVKKVHRIGEKSTPNIYIDNNNISIMKETTVSPDISSLDLSFMEDSEESILDVPNKRILRAPRKDIDIIISSFKSSLASKGYSYVNIKERMMAMNLNRNKEWQGMVEESGGCADELIKSIMEWSFQDAFWNGKISSLQVFYYKWGMLVNRMKQEGKFKRINAKEDNDRKLAALAFFENL